MPSSLHKTNGNTVLYALHEHDIHMHMFTPAMRDAFANVYFCAAGRCAVHLERVPHHPDCES